MNFLKTRRCRPSREGWELFEPILNLAEPLLRRNNPVVFQVIYTLIKQFIKREFAYKSFIGFDTHDHQIILTIFCYIYRLRVFMAESRNLIVFIS